MENEENIRVINWTFEDLLAVFLGILSIESLLREEIISCARQNEVKQVSSGVAWKACFHLIIAGLNCNLIYFQLILDQGSAFLFIHSPPHLTPFWVEPEGSAPWLSQNFIYLQTK